MRTATQLERVRYWQGQLLASGDLQTQMRVVAELRRQHNRAVHGAYGIAIGLTVGEIKDNVLPLSCGLAYDCFGRELMVPVNKNVPLPSPAITSPHFLMIAYDADLYFATLTWQPQGLPILTERVAIARILPGSPGPQLDNMFRPVIARPMARPQLASGETVPGDTAWETWDDNGIIVGVQSVINTSAAGFTTTPNYFAEAVTDNPTKDFVPAWFASIADPMPGSFTLRLFMRRITREAFDILSPRSKVASTPSVGGKVSLSDDQFGEHDQISRLLPVVARASVVTALNGNNATLDDPLDPSTAAEEVAFGNSPRIAKVSNPPAVASSSEVTVNTPENFHVGDVVVKLGANMASARPTTIASIDDVGVLELKGAISGLGQDDQLGIAQTASLVTADPGPTVTVQTPALFQQDDIVVCVDTPELFPPAKITLISGSSNEILTLSPAIPGLQNMHIAPVQLGGTVQSMNSESGQIKIKVDKPKLFRKGDIVAKILPGGIFTEPVSVVSVNSNTSTLTLSGAISGLGDHDEIAVADFRVRSTVLNVVVVSLSVTVADASLYPVGSYIVRLNEAYVPTDSTSITASSGNTLGLHTALKDLKAGDIIALCSFPIAVTVQGIDPDGTIQVSPPNLVKSGDVVASLPGIAIVASASGSSIRLASDIPGLGPTDTLTVVTVSGIVKVTPATTGVSKVKLETGHRVREGDFLADVIGWREPGPLRSVSFVLNRTATDLTLSGQLDGLMVNDTVGLATIMGSGGLLFLLRLNSLPDLLPGDEALLVGSDRLQGQTNSMFAKVEGVFSPLKIVIMLVEGAPDLFSIRPEDLAASILFVRGSPLALVQNQNLYVSWLACQAPNPMPRPCLDSPSSDCPCGKTDKP